MCGIAGFYSFNGAVLSDEALNRASNLLKHRGPDADGIFRSKEVSFVHRRLKILDLSDQANQPMVEKKSGCVLSFNGEIYNFKQLRETLVARGLSFDTQSDTEVLLKGLTLSGADFLKELEGDFAFAFWNPEKNSLLLARDRYGVKPLYIAENENGLHFSSEIKPILAMGFPKTLRRESLPDYFRFRYVPGLKTFFKGIEHFPPGCYLEISKNDRKLVNWAADSRKPKLNFRDTFKNSVEERIEADVEVGLLLSGGVDSGAIGYQIKKLNKNLRAFTFSFNKRSNADEDVENAKNLAARLELKQQIVNESENSYRLYPEVIKALEEPLGDSIILSNYELFANISKSLKVVLSGEGADEIFCGYAHHRVARILSIIDDHYYVKKFLKFAIRFLPAKNFDLVGLYPAKVSSQAKQRLQACLTAQNKKEIFKLISVLFTDNEIAQLLLGGISSSDILMGDSIKEMDMKNWLPRYGLTRTDKLSMAHSVEVRVPYLSAGLNAAAAAEGYDQAGFWLDKPKFRKFCASVLGLNLISRRFRKFPFFIPAESYADPAYQQFVKEKLSRENIRKYWLLNDGYVAQLIQEAELSPDLIKQKKVTAVLIFQIWLETFWPEGLN